MSLSFHHNLESAIEETAKNYGAMLEIFRPFNKGGELNERNLTTQLLMQLKNQFHRAVVCQEFHIPMYSVKGDSAFVDALAITDNSLLFIEAKRNSSITRNFHEIDRDIKKLQSDALRTQFISVCNERKETFEQCAYGIIIADSWDKKITNNWLNQYSNELCPDLIKKSFKIASFSDYPDDYEILFGVFKLNW
jgi:hypothetical protein